MKYQILFSGKNNKNINLSSAEIALRVVMVKTFSKPPKTSGCVLCVEQTPICMSVF